MLSRPSDKHQETLACPHPLRNAESQECITLHTQFWLPCVSTYICIVRSDWLWCQSDVKLGDCATPERATFGSGIIGFSETSRPHRQSYIRDNWIGLTYRWKVHSPKLLSFKWCSTRPRTLIVSTATEPLEIIISHFNTFFYFLHPFQGMFNVNQTLFFVI